MLQCSVVSGSSSPAAIAVVEKIAKGMIGFPLNRQYDRQSKLEQQPAMSSTAPGLLPFGRFAWTDIWPASPQPRIPNYGFYTKPRQRR